MISLRYVKILIPVLLGVILLGCSGESGDSPGPPAPVSQQRNVLVYMVANNNLGSSGYDRADIAEMWKATDAIQNGRLFVFHSASDGTQTLLEIKDGQSFPVIDYDASVPAVSSARMEQVIKDVNKTAPNSSMGLVLWSHASGWIQDGMENAPMRSFGSEGSKKMNITTLQEVLERFNKFDFIYFDCCYMATVETLYQLRNCTDVFVGSATELPSEGMDYSLNLPCFFAQPDADMEAAAANTFQVYDQRTGSMRTCTMSVILSSDLERLAAATATIYSKSGTGIPAGYSPQRFQNVREENCLYFDFYDYVQALTVDSEGNVRYPGAVDDFTRFQNAFSAVVSKSYQTPLLWSAVPLDRHHGLSTYILRSDGDAATKNYSSLGWYTDVASHLIK